MIYNTPDIAKAPGKWHLFWPPPVVLECKSKPMSHRTKPIFQAAQDHWARGAWQLVPYQINLPSCDLLHNAEDDMIKDVGVSINYFLLCIYSLSWILASLMNWEGRSGRLGSLPRKSSRSHLKHYCIHRQQFHTGKLCPLSTPLLILCARDKSRHTHMGMKVEHRLSESKKGDSCHTLC